MDLTLLPGTGYRFTGEKTPAATPRITLGASAWLTAGDSVTDCALITAPSGITVSITEANTNAPNITISGGTHGQRYKLPILITTNYGIKIQVTIFVDVKDHIRVAV